MHGYVISRVTLNLVLGITWTTVMCIAFVLHVLCVHFNYLSLYMAGFRIPTHVVSDRKFLRHLIPLQSQELRSFMINLAVQGQLEVDPSRGCSLSQDLLLDLRDRAMPVWRLLWRSP